MDDIMYDFKIEEESNAPSIDNFNMANMGDDININGENGIV